jgi:hypothetical protein
MRCQARGKKERKERKKAKQSLSPICSAELKFTVIDDKNGGTVSFQKNKNKKHPLRQAG